MVTFPHHWLFVQVIHGLMVDSHHKRLVLKIMIINNNGPNDIHEMITMMTETNRIIGKKWHQIVIIIFNDGWWKCGRQRLILPISGIFVHWHRENHTIKNTYEGHGSATCINSLSNGQVRLGGAVRNYFSVLTILNSTGYCKLPR